MKESFGKKAKAPASEVRDFTPERRDAALRVIEAFEALADERGRGAVEDLLGRIKTSGNFDRRDLLEVLENVPERREFQEKMLAKMEGAGMIEQMENGTLVVDLEKIKDGGARNKLFSSLRGMTDFREGGRYEPYLRYGRQHAYYEVFKHMKVVSREDWDDGEHEGKTLFYEPESEEAAFDPEAIRKADFYMGFWELDGLSSPADMTQRYPSDKINVRLNEAAIAAIVWHPKYGDARRGTDGGLTVQDRRKQARVPVSGEWFTRTAGYWGGPNLDKGIPYSSLEKPGEYLRRYAPNILEKSVLDERDFRRSEGGSDSEQRIERYKVSSNGIIMMNGVQHYLGRKFKDAPIRILEIAPGLGGIVERDDKGQEHLAQTFSVYENGDSRLPTVKWGKGERRSTAGAEFTKVTPYERDRFFRMLPEDKGDIETYRRRLEAVDNLEMILKISYDLEKETGVSLHRLSFEEQAWAAQAVRKSPQRLEETIEVAKKHGLPGVRAFFATEYGSEYGDAVIAISRRLDKETSGMIFRRYGEIVDTVRQESDRLLEEFYVVDDGRPIDREKVNSELLSRAKDIIGAFGKKLSESKGDVDPQAMLAELDRFDRDTALFASMFKVVAKGKEIDFKELKGVTFERKRPAEITDPERQEMTGVLENNWRSQKPEVANFVLDGFKRKLDRTNAATRFSILKKDGKVMAFMRFDERPDLAPNAVYAGSLNVSPELRGSAIGEAMLRKTVDDEAREHVIYADFFPEIDAGTMYVERFGWVVTGVEKVEIGTKWKSERRLTMVRDDRTNRDYVSRQEEATAETLKKRKDAISRDKVRVMRFEFPKQREAFVDAVEQAAKNGQVMTRYFADEKDKNIRYAAFEPRPESSEDDLRLAS